MPTKQEPIYNSKILKDYKEVESIFNKEIDYLVIGDTGEYDKPSIIRNMLTGEILRK